MEKILQRISCIISLIGLIFLFNPNLNGQVFRMGDRWRTDGAEMLKFFGTDTTDIVRIRQLADSCESRYNYYAFLFLAQHGVRDILPRLTECYYQSYQRPWVSSTYYLTAALAILEGQEALPFVTSFFDSMIVQNRELRQTYNANDFVDVIELLIDLKDFSKYEFFKGLFTGYDKPRPTAITKFYRFAEDPSKEQDAYETVRNLFNDPNSQYRYYAMRTLYWFQDHSDRINNYKQVTLNDPSIENRYYASDYLKDLKDYSDAIEGYEALIHSQIDTQYCGWAIMDLKNINSPYAFFSLIKLNNDIKYGYLSEDLDLTISTYEPKEPAPWENVGVSNMIDSLGPFVQQCASLGWLGVQSFVTQLSQYIIDAKDLITVKDSVKCARKIKQFQQAIDKENEDSVNTTSDFVTIEGWKFLYYNAKHILNRLPQIPPDPVINSISPVAVYAGSNAFTLAVNGKNFVSGSTVNWGGNAKPTTFVADSTLQASILASDVAAIDSPLVTVKSADGSAESNSIRFYVVRQRTILEMIDSLRIKLQQCLSQGQIGDKNFVNELDNGLENARKHLVKGDSSNCAKEIAKFQDKLKKEYEKKSNNKRFVTEEGYRILNNSAQAILDRLPGK